ncbi:non-ribosomal peptide synthetase [Streptomyces sp. 7N604]|uniref:non-ribosomal peptide synthetase n=1 Tax=Streptomyces sp. 7N604 TaxID=3457415 RepID=UPI003FD15838
MTTVLQLIAARVHDRPDHVAVQGIDGTLTYERLWSRSLDLARRLRAAGAAAGSIVGLDTRRTEQAVTGWLGIWISGCAVVYLDPDLPAQRRAFLARDCRLALVVTDRDSDTPGDLPGTTMVPLTSPQRSAGPTPTLSSGHGDLAYVCYTSGSTGEPKGVLIEHHGVLNMARGLQQAFRIHAKTRTLQFASWAYDAAVAEMIPTLAAGGTVCLAPDEAWNAGDALADYLRDEHVTLATLTPSVLAATPADRLPDLVSVAAVGEQFGSDLLQQWGRGRHFHNGYGPTEATVAAMVAQLNPGDRVHLGRPLPGVQTRIIDLNTGVRATPGHDGELHIAGASLARGYLNRPDLTAHAFLVESNGTRWYRTGDIVRQHPTNGTVSYVGRRDTQIKLRGQRVELEEVEARLSEHEQVRQCAVVPLGDGSATRLIAHVVPATPGVTERELADFARAWLPAHMVPAELHLMPQLPRTGWGKVDRATLTSTAQQRPAAARQNEDPALAGQNEDLVDTLHALLRDITKSSSLGPDDDVFHHGGHSLLAAQIAVQVKTTWGVELTVLEVFDHPTASALSGLVQARLTAPTPGSAAHA